MGKIKDKLTTDEEVARMFLLGCFNGASATIGHDRTVAVIESALEAFKLGSSNETLKGQ